MYIHMPVSVHVDTRGTKYLLSPSIDPPPYFLRYGLALNLGLIDWVACSLVNSKSPAISASLEMGEEMGNVVPGFCVVFVYASTWYPSSDPHVVVFYPLSNLLSPNESVC